MVKKLIVINPRGFCAGVEMAIKALTWMIKLFPKPIYCYHEIVHNDWIVEVFKKNGVIFVESPSEIPKGAISMLSAHGTSPDVKNLFISESSFVIDSVCPLVTKVHHEAKNLSEKKSNIIYIGHKGHDEAIGAMGVSPDSMTLIESPDDLDDFVPNDPNNVSLLAQTTLAMSEWETILQKSKILYPNLITPRKSDLCYATTNRQLAVKAIAENVDTIIVVGSSTSSNTNALVNTVNEYNTHSLRINSVDELRACPTLEGDIAITAGASAPDHIVDQIIEEINPETIEVFTNTNEEEYFPLPVELRKIHKNLDLFLNHIFPLAKNTQGNFDISNDKGWTATDALNEL